MIVHHVILCSRISLIAHNGICRKSCPGPPVRKGPRKPAVEATQRRRLPLLQRQEDQQRVRGPPRAAPDGPVLLRHRLGHGGQEQALQAGPLAAAHGEQRALLRHPRQHQHQLRPRAHQRVRRRPQGGQRHQVVGGPRHGLCRQLQARPVAILAVFWQLYWIHAAIPGAQVARDGGGPRFVRRAHARLVHQERRVAQGGGRAAGHVRLDDRPAQGDRQARGAQHPGDAERGRLRGHLQVLEPRGAAGGVLRARGGRRRRQGAGGGAGAGHQREPAHLPGGHRGRQDAGHRQLHHLAAEGLRAADREQDRPGHRVQLQPGHHAHHRRRAGQVRGHIPHLQQPAQAGQDLHLSHRAGDIRPQGGQPHGVQQQR